MPTASYRYMLALSMTVMGGTFGLTASACGDSDAAPDAFIPDDACRPVECGKLCPLCNPCQDDCSQCPVMVCELPWPDPDPIQGSIAIVETTQADPVYQGATIDIRYHADTLDSVPPVVGQSPPPLGQCAVWMYSVGQDGPPPAMDQGEMTITGALSPIGTCRFEDTAGAYVCSTGSGTLAAGATITDADADGRVTIANPGAFVGQDSQVHDLVGARLALAGFGEPGNNGVFPVVAQDAAGDTVTVVHPGAVAETLARDGSYTIITGAGPTPANRDFLGSDTAITIEKQPGPDVPAFSVTLTASGEGLTLSSDSAQPHALPVDPPADAIFSCDPDASGVCGPIGGFVTGFVLSGTTTDSDITGLPPDAMPDPVVRWARFQCRGQPGANRITLPLAAMLALLETAPTRIETRLARTTVDANAPYTSVMAGHELLGHTDVPVPAP